MLRYAMCHFAPLLALAIWRSERAACWFYVSELGMPSEVRRAKSEG